MKLASAARGLYFMLATGHPLPMIHHEALYRALGELRTLLAIAVPLMIAQVAQMAMGFADTVMVGRVGAAELAAVGIGLSMWHPLYLFATGALMAESALIARLIGSGRTGHIAALARRARHLAWLFAVPCVLLLRAADTLLFRHLAIDPAIIPVAQEYLDALSWGVPGAFLYLAARFATEGLGQTRPVLIAGLSACAANVLLNWVLIYGHLGFPALGARGCGYATAACLWLEAIGLLYMNRRQTLLRGDAGDGPGLRELLRLGLPIGCAVFFETAIFAAVAIALGRLGPVAVAAHQIALNTSGLTFMIPLALSAAITVRVGRALGAGDLRSARRSGFTGVATAGVFMMLSACCIALAAEPIAALYTRDTAVATLAVTLLHLAAAFQVSDGLQVSASGALRGLHDARATMLITLLAYWGIGFPFGYALAFHFGYGAPGLWFGLIAGLSCAAVLLNLRFFHESRRRLAAPQNNPA
ncbi:MATE family efflux transporter [Plasticicumulans acidivorans]|uniref:Multidrug-efflux transporter n=1 Tax=Plasticicumulans acidivorans TaxID=886464 RepID=A0A317N4M2_9GAMM|nr:MATE family efflux transporter [Plasticicumulans acidivorans]PWV65709.1 MATE family multidrug resistance protein [Plasticicumulans acidivorans]